MIIDTEVQLPAMEFDHLCPWCQTALITVLSRDDLVRGTERLLCPHCHLRLSKKWLQDNGFYS